VLLDFGRRLSAGLEDVDDLYNDLDRALRAANG
jgi:cystathionine beta-lyase/cystathionine gamma-synthase